MWRGGVEFINVLSNSVVFKGLDVNLQGKRVIELGTGTGIVGISALLQGDMQVLFIYFIDIFNIIKKCRCWRSGTY